MRRYMCNTTAITVEAMVESSYNCFHRARQPIWEADWYHCNIASFVGLELTERKNWLDMHFVQKTKTGQFSCFTVTELVRSKLPPLLGQRRWMRR